MKNLNAFNREEHLFINKLENFFCFLVCFGFIFAFDLHDQRIKNRIENVFDVGIHVEPLGDDTEEKKFGVDKRHLND